MVGFFVLFFSKAGMVMSVSFRNLFGLFYQILRNLGVAKVYLWPRFHSLVADTLERNPPGVEELVQGLTGPTKEVLYPICQFHTKSYIKVKTNCYAFPSANSIQNPI